MQIGGNNRSEWCYGVFYPTLPFKKQNARIAGKRGSARKDRELIPPIAARAHCVHFCECRRVRRVPAMPALAFWRASAFAADSRGFDKMKLLRSVLALGCKYAICGLPLECISRGLISEDSCLGGFCRVLFLLHWEKLWNNLCWNSIWFEYDCIFSIKVCNWIEFWNNSCAEYLRGKNWVGFVENWMLNSYLKI